MSKSNDLTAHEKEISPGVYARFPLAGRPELRKRLADLERLIPEAYLAGEEIRIRRELQLARAFPRGRGRRY
jgi:hypothetical protein